MPPEYTAMGMPPACLATAAVVVLLLAVVVLQHRQMERMFRHVAGKRPRDGFVGAFGRSPAMQHCLVYADPNKTRSASFNRCIWD